MLQALLRRTRKNIDEIVKKIVVEELERIPTKIVEKVLKGERCSTAEGNTKRIIDDADDDVKGSIFINY